MTDAPQLLNDVDNYGPTYMRVAARLGSYDDNEADAARIVELLELEPGDRLLDAGCGLGRFTAAVRELGIEAVGVDISSEAIAEAERCYPGPSYRVLDLLEPLPEELGSFDALASLCSSFGYGATEAEDMEMLRAFHRALKPGGKMAMELSDLERSRFRLKTDEGVVERETNGVKETLDVDFSTGMLEVRYELDGETMLSRIRMYEAEDLERMAAEAGFSEISRYGDFAKSPKRPEDRLVLVATA
jgi:SAM-dependent methyltransferase